MKIKKLISVIPITAFIILSFNYSYAQELHGSISEPVYKGGLQALKEFILQNNRYSDKGKIPGVVTLSYTINEAGKIENIKVLRGLNAKCDSEAVRITHLINGWQAAVQFGKPVSVKIIMPIEFYITDENKNDKDFTVTGKVTNKVTGSPIEGTLVLIKGSNIGTTTNQNGDYSITVPGEEDELEYSSIGIEKRSEKIGKNRTINVELLPADIVIDFSSN